MDGIVTGEGVVLDSHAASVASRLLGALIDLAVLAVVVIVGVFAVNGIVDATQSEAAASISGIAFLVVITLVLPVTVDTLTRGRSLGKAAVGIRVVRDDGGPIVFRQAFVRALTGVVELWLTFGIVALLCSMVHPQGKRVGDILAGTYAVRVRGATRSRTPVAPPHHLVDWAYGAEITRLPDGLALTVRQFLHRAPQLHPTSRVELGSRLTTEVARYVQPLPPAGTHPEDFLTAVLAERRRREIGVLERSAARNAAEAQGLHRLPHGVPDPVD